MARNKGGGKPSPKDCPHRNVTKTIDRVEGVTHPIIITYNVCHDCGHQWNETRRG